MSELAAKRILTDEARKSFVASNGSLHSSTPPDLVANLRSVGSRVRKSVTEGYTTHPSYMKSHSTGTVFRSANDTLRDIFPSGLPTTILPSSKLKRTHTRSEYDSDSGVDDGDPEMHSTTQIAKQISMDAKRFNRPIKALRKSRKTIITAQSLPGGSLSFGISKSKSMDGESLKESEEEDWSIPAFRPQGSRNETLNGQTSFEPMILT